jgi:uncharacterized membrane protein YvlD (DUF360 family)
MLRKLLIKIVAGILTIWLADHFLKSVKIVSVSYWKNVLLIGTSLGLISFFIKPILNKITFIFKLLTFGVFEIILNLLIFIVLDAFFDTLQIKTLSDLILITLIYGVIDFLSNIISS